MKTLIIVDAQNDFMQGGPMEVNEGDQIIPVINKIQDNFDLVVATQDWHPSNHISFVSQHEGHTPFEKITIKGMEQILWPDHCVRNSKGAELHPELKTDRIEAIFRKGMDVNIDSYSGFYDNNHEKTTGLAGYLREKGATELYFTGLAADICVYFTLKDALGENLDSTLIEDGTRPLDKDNFEKLKKELRKEGAKFINSNEI